jgi:hypothetical protein
MFDTLLFGVGGRIGMLTFGVSTYVSWTMDATFVTVSNWTVVQKLSCKDRNPVFLSPENNIYTSSMKLDWKELQFLLTCTRHYTEIFRNVFKKNDKLED